MPLPAGAIRLGYLDKNRPRQAARLARAFGEAHLFILPTRADCTPMVVAEANIHGTPVLITDTGGIGSLMAEGRNGRMLPMAAGPDDWAAAIHDLTADPKAHAALCRSSFAHARDRLTWEAWARDVTALLRGAIRA
jgi:glycosyltransferase involved in cell wall biosynthesis